MIIYVDLVFFINFLIDFTLLLAVNISLKRYSKLYRIIFGSLIGSISLGGLFININYILNIALKIIMAFSMVVVSFGYKNIKYTFYNFIYLYMCSMILGGFLYYMKLNVSYNIIIIFIGIIFLMLFVKSLKVLREIKNYYYKVKIVFNNNFNLDLVGFLDSGNRMVDPISKRPVIIINRKQIKGKIKIRSPMYVPFNTVNNHGVMECIKPNKLYVNNILLNNYLIGLSDEVFKLNGANCLLNFKVWEDMND